MSAYCCLRGLSERSHPAGLCPIRPAGHFRAGLVGSAAQPLSRFPFIAMPNGQPVQPQAEHDAGRQNGSDEKHSYPPLILSP
jgi:hypothetical protein